MEKLDPAALESALMLSDPRRALQDALGRRPGPNRDFWGRFVPRPPGAGGDLQVIYAMLTQHIKITLFTRFQSED